MDTDKFFRKGLLLKEFIDEYRLTRPHQGLNVNTPIPQEKVSKIIRPSKLISIPVLGGFHHRYQRVAAWPQNTDSFLLS
jgi:hypothetical protein